MHNKGFIKSSLALLFLITSGCAIAPLTEEHTAQTLGKGNNEWAIQGGMGSSLAYKRGLTDRFDAGIMVEYQYQNFGALMALTGKYMIIDSQTPTSLIGNIGFGTGSTFGSIGVIQDLIKRESYLLSFNVRYNVFNWDFSDGDDADEAQDFLDEIIDGVINEINGTYTYASINMANTFYFNPGTGVTLNLGGFMLFEDGAEFVPNVGLKLHFDY
jgi:hypothetical protein